MNVAMQWQSLKTEFDSTINLSNTTSTWFYRNIVGSQPHGMANPNSKILTSRELQSTFYPIAFVMGYVKPMGKKSDISFRFYGIQRNFRPPQGLFNEFQRNHERLSLTVSSTPNWKYSVKYGAEIGKNLRYDASGEKPVTVSYQLGVSAKYSKEWSSELLWQLRRNSDPLAWEYDAATHYSASPGVDYRMEYGGLNSGRPQNSNGFRGRTTVVALYRPAEGWAVKGKISLLPTSSPLPQNSIWPRSPGSNNTNSSNQNASNQPPQNTYLYGIPNVDQTTQGYGANCLVEYSFKFKTHPAKKSIAGTEKSNAATPKSNNTNHKARNHKVQTAFRAEFLHKNNSQFPNQPRIFVSLCWK